MKKIANKKFVLVNLASDVNSETLTAIFNPIKHVGSVNIYQNPKTTFSKYFACVTLVEPVQPYYLQTMLEKIRQEKLNGLPLLIIPMFLPNPMDVNSVFDKICQLILVDDLTGLRKAEALSFEMSIVERKIRRLGTDQLIQAITDVFNNKGLLDINSIENRVDGFLTARLEEIRIKAGIKPKNKKKKRKSHRSVNAILTPMGGQPERRRR